MRNDQDNLHNPTNKLFIEKINKHLSNLDNLVNRSFKNDESFSFDSIEEAFINNTNLAAMTQKYNKFLEVFRHTLNQLKVKYKKNKENLYSFEKFNLDLTDFRNLKNALVDFRDMYIYSTKQKILDLNTQMVFEESEERYNKLLNEFNKSINELKEYEKQNNFNFISFSKQDIEYVEALPKKFNKFNFKWWWVFALIGVASLVMIGLSIWKLI